MMDLVIESNLENVKKIMAEKFDLSTIDNSSDMQSFCDELIKIGLFKDYKSLKLFLLIETMVLAESSEIDLPIFYIDSIKPNEYSEEEDTNMLTDSYIKNNF